MDMIHLMQSKKNYLNILETNIINNSSIQASEQASIKRKIKEIRPRQGIN